MHTRWNKVYTPSKKGYWVCLTCLCLFWWGCTDPQEETSAQQVPLRSAAVEASLAVGEVFTPPQLLELELPDDQAIGAIKRIINFDTHWALLHQMVGEAGYTLSVFTGDGSYVFGLRRDAAIPGTFSPKDIFLSPSGHLGVLDQTGSRLLDYDLTGQALSERPLPCMAQTVAYEPVHDQYVLTRGRQSANNEDTSYFYNLLFLDSALTLVQKFDPYTIPVGERAIVNFPNPVTITPDGTVYYARLFTDHLSAFQQGLRTPTRDIAFEMNGGLASVKEGMENNGNMVELVQEYLNAGSMLLAGNFFWAGNAHALYFNRSKARSSVSTNQVLLNHCFWRGNWSGMTGAHFRFPSHTIQHWGSSP